MACLAIVLQGKLKEHWDQVEVMDGQPHWPTVRNILMLGLRWVDDCPSHELDQLTLKSNVKGN